MDTANLSELERHTEVLIKTCAALKKENVHLREKQGALMRERSRLREKIIIAAQKLKKIQFRLKQMDEAP